MIELAMWLLMVGVVLLLMSKISQLKEDMARMSATLNAIAKQVDVPDPINDELKNSILELISKGEKIKAIKEYRTTTGAGLVEAKQYIDSLSE